MAGKRKGAAPLSGRQTGCCAPTCTRQNFAEARPPSESFKQLVSSNPRPRKPSNNLFYPIRGLSPPTCTKPNFAGLARPVAVCEMSVQHLRGAGTVCKMTMQHLHGLFTVCKMTVQHLHGPFTVCGGTMQHLHSPFTVCGETMQHLHGLFTVCETIMQHLHSLVAVCAPPTCTRQTWLASLTPKLGRHP